MARRSAMRALILRISPFRDDPQVSATIVEPIPVNVVTLAAVAHSRHSEQLAVQRDDGQLPVNHLAAFGVPVVEAPDPLTGPFGIGGVHRGVPDNGHVVARKNRNQRGAIRLHDRRQRRSPSHAARLGAERTLVNARRRLLARASAGQADDGKARRILSGHRSHSFGVAPRAVASSAGASELYQSPPFSRVMRYAYRHETCANRHATGG